MSVLFSSFEFYLMHVFEFSIFLQQEDIKTVKVRFLDNLSLQLTLNDKFAKRCGGGSK